MSVLPRPTTTASARIRQLGAAGAWLAAGGMLLYVLMRFGPALVDTFAHGDIGWLRLLIIVVALAGADVGGLMLVLHGLKLLHRALGASAVWKVSMEKEA